MQAIAWLHCIVAVCCNTDVLTGNADGNADDAALAALLLDRRLIKAKGPRLTSFVGGGVLPFLLDASLFPDSAVLDVVPPDTLEAFTSLIRHELGTAGRRFKLLFRSSQDGASAAAFHGRCDAQGPTLTLIRDMAGNVFGGYTSLHWSSPANEHAVYVQDPAAFLFTAVNPHGDPPALFLSRAAGCAIVCASHYGPIFNTDLYVSGAFENGHAYIGASYENPTRHDGRIVLTGAGPFTAAEVEVWGLADD